MIPAEWVRALLDRETTVIAEDVSVATRAILSVNNDVRLDIVSHGFIAAQRVESPRVLRYVRCRRSHLVRRRMPYRETTVVIGDIFVSIVAALAEAFLEAVAFVH